MLIRKRCGNSEKASRCSGKLMRSGFKMEKGGNSAASREELGFTSHHTPSVSFKPGTVSSCYSVSELSLHLAPSDMDSSALSLSSTPPAPHASCATGCLPHCVMNTWGNLRVLSQSLCHPLPLSLSLSLPLSPTSIKHAKNHGKCPTNTATPAPSCEGWSDPDQAKRHQP